MQVHENKVRPSDEDDTQPENAKDIGEQPTLRRLRIAHKAEEGAPATVGFGSGTALGPKASSE
jgi:hypothetical protein